LAAVLGLFILLRCSPYPDLERFRERPWSIRFLDRNGKLLQITALDEGLRREYRPLEEIPEELRAIIVFSEDRRFYDHIGIDPLSIIRALFQNLSGRRQVSGASTITMQLARILATGEGSLAGGEGALGRKLAEAWNALRLEARLSKDEILEFYLNSLPFAFQTEGAASAARTFFASELAMLSPAQMFCLAVIPRRPGSYNPLDHPEACIAAAAELQGRFARSARPAAAYPLLAAVSAGDWDYAAVSARRFVYPFEMPHLIRLAAGEARKTEIVLSAELELQQYLEGLVAGNVERYYQYRLTNGAAMVINNGTGEILAWVGSADYSNQEAGGQIDGVLALNQPGSSMKPFLYALALEQGFAPTEVLADVPMNFGTEALYIPQNFNNRFNGPMLFRSALASSLNIPAVYLLYRLGLENYRQFLLSLGFDSLAESAREAGLGLALGNAPVSLAELARAFSALPRDGRLLPLSWLKAGPDSPAQDAPEASQAISPDTARIICAFLSDRSARVLAFGAGGNFETAFQAMFKTGTANQYQSIVALGASPEYTVAVWMGNFTGETVMGKTGSSLPAAIVRDTLVFLQGSKGPVFAEPEAYSLQPVCALSGMRPTEDCISVVREYVAHGKELEDCTWHRGSSISYPAEYQAWFAAAPRQGSVDYASRPLEIISPRDGFEFLSGPGAREIPVEVIGGRSDTLEVLYDGRRFTQARPFVFFLPHEPGSHSLTVRSGDEEQSLRFSVVR
jgi:penicillin-binding protein 1C